MKKFIARIAVRIFNIDRCIGELSGFQLLIELAVILIVILALSSPAWLPGLFSWNS